MKKIKFIFVISLMLAATFVGGQTPAANEVKKEGTIAGSTKSVSASDTGSIKIKKVIESSFSVLDGFVVTGGASFKSSNKESKFPEIRALLSFGMPLNSSQTTSFLFHVVTYPCKSKFGTLWGFGFKTGYYYRCKVKGSGLIKNKALATDLIKDISSNWITQTVTFMPLVEFSVPIGERVRMGTQIPLLLGSWDYIPENKGWSHAKQWIDIGFCLSVKLGSVPKKIKEVDVT